MDAFKKALSQGPVVYVTRDVERAGGAPTSLKNYFIVTNYTPFGQRQQAARPGIVLIKNQKLLDTRELLAHPAAARLLRRLRQPAVVVFKNTPAIERLCAQRGWKLLNPPAELAARVEEKITQVEWLGPLAAFLPPHQVLACRQVRFRGEPFILQFNRAHTGSGTVLVKNKGQLAVFQKQFPDRPVRVTKFISGPIFTNNNVVWGRRVLVGNINYQITGLRPFTERPFATIGNDWALPPKLLSKKQFAEYAKMARAVGRRLEQSGWKGLFGIDAVADDQTGRLYLLEINARQPASTSCESWLQTKEQGVPTARSRWPSGFAIGTKTKEQKKLEAKNYCTTFEAHLAALLDLPENQYELIPITNGAQIVQKRIKNIELRIKNTEFEKNGFTIVPYTNPEPESDWLRVQSKTGIMKEHAVLNDTGKKIMESLKIGN